MKKITLMLSLALASYTLSAQKTIRELADLPDKKFEKLVQTTNYASQVQSFAKNYEKQTGKTLPSPVVPSLKRVGILTFFSADHSYIDPKKYRRGQTFENYLTEAGGFQLVSQLYDQSISGLKEAFAANGMELLTPSEFIQTSDQKEVYNTYEVEMSKLLKATVGLASFYSSSKDKSFVAVDGYRVFPEPPLMGGMDIKVVQTVGPLAEKLGLDAVLSIQILTSLEKSDVGINAVRMTLHSPNPVPDDPAMKYGLGFYYNGILVESAGIELETPIQFAELPKKAKTFTNVNVDGFGDLTIRMSKLMIDNVEIDYVNGGKKK